MKSRIMRQVYTRRMRTLEHERCRPALVIGAVLLAVSSAATAPAQTRVEFHMLPPVSTGPRDPAWSPDGEWIAFSMRGDIWKVPAEGGEAIALTEGPAYHFEPAWSRDGTRIALTYEIDGDLEIGIVNANGGVVQRVTRSPGYDLQPVWSADDRSIFFTSRRNGGFDILSASPTTPGNVQQGNLRISEIAGGRGNQFQPSISPDGHFIAYVAPAGSLGSGGIWAKRIPLASAAPSNVEPQDDLDEPRLVHDEETSYRADPAWSADGSSIF